MQTCWPTRDQRVLSSAEHPCLKRTHRGGDWEHTFSVRSLCINHRVIICGSLNKICWCCSLNRSLGFLVTLFYGTPCEAGVNFSVIQRRPQTAVIRESFPTVYTSDSLLLCFSHSSSSPSVTRDERSLRSALVQGKPHPSHPWHLSDWSPNEVQKQKPHRCMDEHTWASLGLSEAEKAIPSITVWTFPSSLRRASVSRPASDAPELVLYS